MTADTQPKFDDAMFAMSNRLAASLGKNGWQSLTMGGEGINSEEQAEHVIRSLLLGLIEPEELDYIVPSLRLMTVLSAEAGLGSNDPITAFSLALAQILTAGIMHGRATR